MNKFILLRTYNSLTEAELDFIKLRDEELDVYMADNNMASPNCGSSNYFQERSFFLGILILLLFILPVSIGNNINHCVNCDHRWKIN